MHVYEWLTIAALLLGPIMAVGIQLFFEHRRESRKRKLHVLDTLMAYRGRLVSPEPVRALNLIDVVFYDSLMVRSKWAELFAEFERGRQLSGDELAASFNKRDDLTAELIAIMSTALGYTFTHNVIKSRRYNPQGFVDEDEYQMAARKAILQY